MDSVIEACTKGINAMLESPTGTGKTLSLLCSSLAWLHNERKKIPEGPCPRIIYLARTHSQLSQVIKELKKTVYRPVVSVLASRDVLCINKSANFHKGLQLNVVCKKLKKSNMCAYAYGKIAKHPEIKNEVMDIEDLQRFGVKAQMCPFYASRELAPCADILFMPYNYILDSKIRAQCSSIHFTNAVLIFDEAHNVQKVSEDSSSFEISINELKKCIDEVKQLEKIKQSISMNEGLYNDIKKDVDELSYNDIEILRGAINNFMQYLSDIENVSDEGLVLEGKRVFDIFINGTKGNTEEEANSIGNRGISIDNWYQYIAISNLCTSILASRNSGIHIDQWAHIIERVYSFMVQDSTPNKSISKINDFKVYISNDIEGSISRKKGGRFSLDVGRNMNGRSLKAFCFNPGLGFTELIKESPRCIILTSGTLSPMESLEKELRIKFPIKYESTHVIDVKQVFIQVLTRDHDGSLFNFNYQNRANVNQKKNLGKLIQDICCISPGGVLVFFSGYSMMTQCYDIWNTETIEKRSGKRVYKEAKTAAENQLIIEQFNNDIHKSGAILFAVCRGKISEGIDFADDAARTVIVIGVPFPSMTDKKVTLKREYLDYRSQSLQINGKSWYIQEAIKAVNQSIGRVIRHIKDYGAIVLVDQRYANDWLKNHLSKWLRDQIKVTGTCEDCIELLEGFFNKMSEDITVEYKPPVRSKMVAEFKPAAKSVTIERKKRKRKELNGQVDKPNEELKITPIKIAKASSKKSKEEHIKDLYDTLFKVLGKKKMKTLMCLIKEHQETKENRNLFELANQIHELFKNNEESNEVILERTNDALRKTVDLIPKTDKKEYEQHIANLIK